MRIDVHCHAFPQRYLDFEAKHYAGAGDATAETGKGAIRVRRQGMVLPAFDEAGQLAVMDEHEVDVQIISLPRPYHFDGKDQLALDMARLANDCYADIVARHPTRFRAFATVPLTNPDNAIAEMQRAFDDLGFQGVILGTSFGHKYLDEELFRPFFQEVNRRRLPVFMHPVSGECPASWSKFGLMQKLGWCFETSICTARMMLSGFFDDFGEFPFITSHLGGPTLALIHRTDRAERACKEEPTEYMKRIYYDTAGPTHAPGIECAVRLVGATQVLFGTDYPFGSRDPSVTQPAYVPTSIGNIIEARITAEERELIFHGNAERILGVQVNA